jgi:hypothetical protein
MIIKKLLSIIKSLIIIQSKLTICEFLEQKETPINCVLHNIKYSNEYLYASNNIFTTDIINYKNPNHNIYIVPDKSVDDFSKLKWTIKQTDQTNGTITIRSNKDEYLCASNLYHDLFHQRRRVYLKANSNKKSIIDNVNRNCEWRLEQSIGQIYIVWNEFYNEPLYAPSFFYKYNSIKRYVYLWKKKPSTSTSSEEFKWFIDCSKSGHH